MEFKKFEIENEAVSDEGLTVTDLDDDKKCYIMVSQYLEICGISLTMTKVKRLIKALERWVKFAEARKGKK